MSNEIRVIQPVIASAPSQPVLPVKSDAAPALPAISPPAPDASEAQFDAKVAEHRQREAVQRAAQDFFIVSDKTFSLFKDATGQYITRFTSLRDGKVTYIPQPELFKISGKTAELPSSLDLQA